MFLIAFRRKIPIPHIAYKTLPDLFFHRSASTYFPFLCLANRYSFLTFGSGQFLSQPSFSSLYQSIFLSHQLYHIPLFFFFLSLSFPLPAFLESKQCILAASVWHMVGSYRILGGWMGGVDKMPLIKLLSLNTTPNLLYSALPLPGMQGYKLPISAQPEAPSQVSPIAGARGKLQGSCGEKGLAPSFLWVSRSCQ